MLQVAGAASDESTKCLQLRYNIPIDPQLAKRVEEAPVTEYNYRYDVGAEGAAWPSLATGAGTGQLPTDQSGTWGGRFQTDNARAMGRAFGHCGQGCGQGCGRSYQQGQVGLAMGRAVGRAASRG